MAEHDADREDREDKEDREDHAGREGRGKPGPEERRAPFDEDAAWAAIVAGYGDEPPDPPGAKPFKSVEDLALLEPVTNDDEPARPAEDTAAPAAPLGSSVSFAPGVGPRDYAVAEPSDSDLGPDDEGHFVPPEPPPLPQADPTAKFAWLAVIGGPLLLLVAVLLRWDMTWWLATLGIGGFLGGFATLVARMRTDDEDGDDPGRGAVV